LSLNFCRILRQATGFFFMGCFEEDARCQRSGWMRTGIERQVLKTSNLL
jgi:hypothetical protein